VIWLETSKKRGILTLQEAVAELTVSMSCDAWPLKSHLSLISYVRRDAPDLKMSSHTFAITELYSEQHCASKQLLHAVLEEEGQQQVKQRACYTANVKY
jgi:hypothetical protein